MIEQTALDDLFRRMQTLAASINAPLEDLPRRTYEYLREGLWIDVQEKPDRFRLNHTERGTPRTIVESADADVIAEEVLVGLTIGMASREAAAHSEPGRSAREQYFEIHERLVAQLDAAWAERLKKRHAALLDKQPFVFLK